MRKVLLATSLASMFVFSSGAQAERSFGEIYTDCGLGGLIAQGVNDKGTADLIAIVTNVTWDLGTTAVSSNISSPDTCARDSAMTAAFILKSYAQLEKDLVLGHGQYLDALAEVVDVAPVDRAAFIQTIRAEFAEQAVSADYELLTRQEKAEQLFNIVASRS